MNGKNIEITDKTKLLGVIISNDLKWEDNTDLLIKKANARMQLLRKCASFTKDKNELKNIYILFVRSILEQSCVVWHSSINQENSESLERVQKSAIKIILQEEYIEYPDGLLKLNLETLSERRKTLCQNFAVETAKHESLKHLFPTNKNATHCETRQPEKFHVNMAYTERYKSSAVPQMQRLLNDLHNDEE